MNETGMIICVILGAVCLLLFAAAVFLYLQIRKLRSYVTVLKEDETGIQVPVDFPLPEAAALVKELNALSEKYRQTVTELRHKDETIKETITNLAHDVRTPLTSIEGYAKMLSNAGTLTEEEREAVGVIIERADTLKRLLNQLFDYARIESGGFEYHVEQLDLNAILRNTAVSFYSQFESKKADPVVEISEEVFPYVADRDAVTRVFSNLLFNALVHGTKDYYVASKRENESYVFLFRNDAADVTGEDVERIFERFYTTDKSRSKKTTGLGLSIAKRIVTDMGGTIKASLEGEGNVFEIKIEFPVKN
ncbi:MAG: HAMP domain-containing histidine kinase [Lachnospiraceae bacterium]|nr:HAMP domain-containing histidine kinase [Lachnospiraceae bacterium]